MQNNLETQGKGLPKEQGRLFKGQALKQVYTMVMVGSSNWKGWPAATLTQSWQQESGYGCLA
jgi:hypothetical protein